MLYSIKHFTFDKAGVFGTSFGAVFFCSQRAFGTAERQIDSVRSLLRQQNTNSKLIMIFQI